MERDLRPAADAFSEGGAAGGGGAGGGAGGAAALDEECRIAPVAGPSVTEVTVAPRRVQVAAAERTVGVESDGLTTTVPPRDSRGARPRRPGSGRRTGVPTSAVHAASTGRCASGSLGSKIERRLAAGRVEQEVGPRPDHRARVGVRRVGEAEEDLAGVLGDRLELLAERPVAAREPARAVRAPLRVVLLGGARGELEPVASTAPARRSPAARARRGSG